MTNNFKIGFIISTVLVITLIGCLIYIWTTRTQRIGDLNSQILSLNSEIQSKNQELKKLDENFKLVKFVCLYYVLQCREAYNERLRQNFLQSRNLQNAQYQSSSTGENYYKYFLDPQPPPNLPLKLKEFIKSNCPTEVYKTPGKLLSRYIYDVNGNELSIGMDEETLDILCSWIYDKAADSYSQP